MSDSLLPGGSGNFAKRSSGTFKQNLSLLQSAQTEWTDEGRLGQNLAESIMVMFVTDMIG